MPQPIKPDALHALTGTKSLLGRGRNETAPTGLWGLRSNLAGEAWKQAADQSSHTEKYTRNDAGYAVSLLIWHLLQTLQRR